MTICALFKSVHVVSAVWLSWWTVSNMYSLTVIPTYMLVAGWFNLLIVQVVPLHSKPSWNLMAPSHLSTRKWVITWQLQQLHKVSYVLYSFLIDMSSRLICGVSPLHLVNQLVSIHLSCMAKLCHQTEHTLFKQFLCACHAGWYHSLWSLYATTSGLKLALGSWGRKPDVLGSCISLAHSQPIRM